MYYSILGVMLAAIGSWTNALPTQLQSYEALGRAVRDKTQQMVSDMKNNGVVTEHGNLQGSGDKVLCADGSIRQLGGDDDLPPDCDCEPTRKPTSKPVYSPTYKPTEKPTYKSTDKPTHKPTHKPTREPTYEPTYESTDEPTASPVVVPSFETTPQPTYAPTGTQCDGGCCSGCACGCNCDNETSSSIYLVSYFSFDDKCDNTKTALQVGAWFGDTSCNQDSDSDQYVRFSCDRDSHCIVASYYDKYDHSCSGSISSSVKFEYNHTCCADDTGFNFYFSACVQNDFPWDDEWDGYVTLYYEDDQCGCQNHNPYVKWYSDQCWCLDGHTSQKYGSCDKENIVLDIFLSSTDCSGVSQSTDQPMQPCQPGTAPYPGGGSDDNDDGNGNCCQYCQRDLPDCAQSDGGAGGSSSSGAMPAVDTRFVYVTSVGMMATTILLLW